MRQLFYYKMRQMFIAKCAMLFITEHDSIITKCDFNYKKHRYSILSNYVPHEHEAIICNDRGPTS